MTRRRQQPPEQPAQTPRPVPLDQAMAMASRHWEAGQAAEAEAICNRVLAVQPGNSDALHLLGLMAHHFGKKDLAIDLLKRATAAFGAPARHFSNLAEMCRQRGRLEEGEAAGRTAVGRDPTDALAWNNLAIILQERGTLEEALAAQQRCLRLKPDFAEAHNNLANTLKKLGDLTAAEAAYQRALALRPDYAEAHGNRAAVLDLLGRHDDALAAADRAVTLNPGLSDAYITASAVLRTLGRKEEALPLATRAVAAAADGGDPVKIADALTAQANCLKVLNRLDEALAVCRQAVSVKPDHGASFNALGTVLQQMGRHEEAIAVFERAAELLPQPSGAFSNLGTLLTEMGRKAEAEAALRRALEAEPDSAASLFNLADLKTFTVGDPDIACMEALLERQPAPSFTDRMSLHFALGKAYDDIGDVARAAAHLDAGNRMKRSIIRYDADATSRWVGRIAASFPAPVFDRLAPETTAPEAAVAGGPIFIVGMPRSGTSLVEQILASHPAVHGAGELTFVNDIIAMVKDAAGRSLVFPDFMEAVQPADLARMGEVYRHKVAALAPAGVRVVDKMPANFLHVGLIRLMLPDARFIHCRRNPVDTCLSCYSKLFAAEQTFSYDQAELGRFHRDYQGLMAHWHDVLPPSVLTDVVYEDVVADLEGQARRLIAFCGLEWDDACVAFHKTRRPVRTASANQVRKPLYATSVERWRPYAPHLGPLLAALGVDAG